MIKKFTDEELIEGLRQRNSSCIDYLYEKLFPVVRHHLTENSGNQQDAEDLWQDAMMVLYNRCMNQPFILGCSLKTYFMAVCKNLWLQRLERKYRLLYQADYEVHEPIGTYTMDEYEQKEENLERLRLFYKHLMMLPEDCRRILQLYCLKVPYTEIARLLNYKDDVYVKTRKYYCKNLLRKRIMKDPECQQYINYNGN